MAEAARRAREKKKDASKPVKVITDETLDVRKGDVQSAAAEEAKMPGAPTPNPPGAKANPQVPPGAAAANAAASSAGPAGSQEEKLKKEVATLKEQIALKEQIKQLEGDLQLLQRTYRLDQESYYSKVNYASDTTGKQKLDDENQQISDKREEVARLKAKLADLEQASGPSAPTPPQP